MLPEKPIHASFLEIAEHAFKKVQALTDEIRANIRYKITVFSH